MCALSKLAKKCRECPFVSKCDKKKMEMYGYLEIPSKIEMGNMEAFYPSALDASKEEKEKFIMQQIESAINTTEEEKKKYFLQVYQLKMANTIKAAKGE